MCVMQQQNGVYDLLKLLEISLEEGFPIIPRKFTVIRDKELCINCGCCVRQCSNECHYFDEDGKTVLVNSKNCVTRII